MKEKKNIKKVKLFRLRWLRVLVQIAAFWLAPALFAQAFSAVKEAAAAIGNGHVLSYSGFVSSFIILCGVTILAGRIFCGWLCAFGAVNDWIYQFSSFIQKKTGKKLPGIPQRLIPFLQKIKYIILFLVLFCYFLGQNSWITKNSPWTVFSLLTAGNLKLAGYGTAIAFGGLIVLGMAFHERFFCQFLCPMGAVFSLLPELPLTALHREEKNCIPGCQACRKNCPAGIRLGENSLQAGECIRCGRCYVICPKENITLLLRGEEK